MADGLKTPVKPESPTTARPLDFDDEPLETGVTSTSPAARTPGEGLAPPPKPPRPVSPLQEAENTLKEAFPTIDSTVVRAVVVASDGNVDRAFHALLGMSDPDAQVDLPPMKPPRPSAATTTAQSQLEQDELYARQLAEHYDRMEEHRSNPRSLRDHEPHVPRQHRETGLKPNELYDDREHSFLDDDLPIIKENIRKGFLETQTRVNAWMQNLKKKLDGEESEDELRPQPGRPGQQYGQGFGEAQAYRPRRSGEARRSADRERYDADPRVLSDDFASLELRDAEAASNRPPRPAANPNLFTPKSPSPDRRRVSFQEGPPEEIGGPNSRPHSHNRGPPSGSKPSKWQPLASVDPSPVADHDPFSLGDSDDEKEAKKQELKPEEAEKLKKDTAEAMAGDIGSSSTDVKTDKAP